MTILKLRQANNPESTTKLAYIRELCDMLNQKSPKIEMIENETTNHNTFDCFSLPILWKRNQKSKTD